MLIPSAKAKVIKAKRCKAPGCGNEFMPARPMQKACSPGCALSMVAAANAKKATAAAKADRKETKVKLEKFKNRNDWLKDAQTSFNKFIRERDRDQKCICCGNPLGDSEVGGGFDCGHYRSVGSAPHLRFNENNAHGQRKVCNRWGAGRAVDYRLGLIARIGLARVEALEADQTVRKYTIDELREIKARYVQKAKELKNG